LRFITFEMNYFKRLRLLLLDDLKLLIGKAKPAGSVAREGDTISRTPLLVILVSAFGNQRVLVDIDLLFLIFKVVVWVPHFLYVFNTRIYRPFFLVVLIAQDVASLSAPYAYWCHDDLWHLCFLFGVRTALHILLIIGYYIFGLVQADYLRLKISVLLHR
jgi:hypothetical protein